jgi:hypothetical protein
MLRARGIDVAERGRIRRKLPARLNFSRIIARIGCLNAVWAWCLPGVQPDILYKDHESGALHND